jgi:peptide/nickel transport system ATP-binding protein
MLRLDGVTKVYRTGTFGGGKLHAVNNVSFDVKDGEVVSLIGESGSGKSTIGKLILGLISPSSGTIECNGINVAALQGAAVKEYYRTVQGVFQDPFSTYNPIYKADRIFRIIREEFYPDCPAAEWTRKVTASLKAVGLNPEQVVDKYPHQLSGGQLQRFLIARALLLDIRFLVADEIISMLDASTRIDVLNLLVDLKSRGLSILFITHDLSLGYYISERTVILYHGCIMEIGVTKRIFDHPLHPYTKMLMASVPRIDKKWGTTVPELKIERKDIGGGCEYYDRCTDPGRSDDCLRVRPPLVEAEKGHFVACCRMK